MARLEWSNYDPQGFARLEPGVHHVEITTAKEKVSKKGDPMIEVVLCLVGTGERVCWDYIMLGGSGANIGYSKLIGLGFAEGIEAIEAADFVGRRAYAWFVDEERQDETGKIFRGLRVDIRGGPHCGYAPDGEPPMEFHPADAGDQETPFG